MECGKHSWCSKCRPGENANRGKPKSDAHNQAVAEGRKRHLLLDLPDCKCYGHYRIEYRATSLERVLVEVLLAEFPVVEHSLDGVNPKVRFGRYLVDAYLPSPYHLAFEADGEFWHDKRRARDKRRDEELLRRFGLHVVRMTGRELLDLRKVNRGGPEPLC